jgi:phosphoribosylaminoimidazole-succinocarboxamide synthase
MAHIPPSVGSEPLEGMDRISEGKARDKYLLNDHPDKLFVLTTERISVHDFVLNREVPGKGAVLNLLDIYLRMQMDKPNSGIQIKHDLVAWGEEIDQYLPKQHRGNPELHMCGRVVKKLDMLDAEIICRGLLTGSAWDTYCEGKPVSGQTLPPRLNQWDVLKPVLFTPSTKATEGHDVAMVLSEFRNRFGPVPEFLARQLFDWLTQFYADRGYVFVDTKFEFGIDPATSELVVGDEIGTPDSSRLLRPQALAEARRDSKKKPPSPDKQPVRDWASENLGISPKSKVNAANIALVDQAHIPDEVIDAVSGNYRNFLTEVTGLTPKGFLAIQRNALA